MRRSERATWETYSSFPHLKVECLKVKFHAWKILTYPLLRAEQHLASKTVTKGKRSSSVIHSAASAHLQLLHLESTTPVHGL